MTKDAWHQRVTAPLKTGEHSLVMKNIIQKQGLTEKEQEILVDEKISIWKKFNTPALMLMDEYANYKTLVNAKLLAGDDPTSKEIQGCLKLLLDIAKEINRLRTVSADKRFEAFSKSFSSSDEIVIDVGLEDEPGKEE